MSYHLVLSHLTQRKISRLARRIARGDAVSGMRVARLMNTGDAPITPDTLLKLLIRSKEPCIFAESEVAGDGSDWTAEELDILGDISIAAHVTVFDDGRHQDPQTHEPSFEGTLVFTPGALLRNDRGGTPPDFLEVVEANQVNPDRYYQLYERRLLPVLKFIDATAAARGRSALVTIPGLGCGQFAGMFKGTLGSLLRDTLKRLLAAHSTDLKRVRVVIYDPYNECGDETTHFDGLEFRVRPLLHSANPRPQLCHPVDYQEQDDDFGECDLFSVVAWDPVSWPGNDFYKDARATDDGVKAAATNAMAAFTGIEGSYDPDRHRYRPPNDYQDWGEVGARNKLVLEATDVFATESAEAP
jgi:hypothetical protein